jgi:N-formylglutamate deformylase
MQQLILHVPHSSVNIPLREGYIIDDRMLNSELLKLTDWYTDDLFYSESDIMVRAEFSRLFCDPERFSDDEQEVMAKFGMGVLYEKTDGGEIMRKVSVELRERILNEYYSKHHNKLNNAVNSQLRSFGSALILDCHSFPDIPLLRDLNQDASRPDFNIGTDAFHTPQKLIDMSLTFFIDKGYTIEDNAPYKGSIVPMEHYIKNQQVHSIMLEINRKLYLNEGSNEKSSGYGEIKSVTQEYMAELKKHF